MQSSTGVSTPAAAERGRSLGSLQPERARTRGCAVGGERGGGVAGGGAAHRLHSLGLDLAQAVDLGGGGGAWQPRRVSRDERKAGMRRRAGGQAPV